MVIDAINQLSLIAHLLSWLSALEVLKWKLNVYKIHKWPAVEYLSAFMEVCLDTDVCVCVILRDQ